MSLFQAQDVNKQLNRRGVDQKAFIRLSVVPFVEWTIRCFEFYGTHKAHNRLTWPRVFPGGASGKEPSCQSRRHKRCEFNPWVGKIPWRRAWQPTSVFLPGESHGQRSWQATVHRVTKSWTWLKWLSTAQHNTGSFNAKATQTKY